MTKQNHVHIRRTLFLGALTLIAGLQPLPAADEKADEMHLTRDYLPKDLRVVDDIVYKEAGGQKLALMLLETPEKRTGKTPLVHSFIGSEKVTLTNNSIEDCEFE